jgi:hypothetical protein
MELLLHPARGFNHPQEVIEATGLSIEEKRAILSSWASDACAVESAPALRRPTGSKQFVAFDDILDALQSLDNPNHPADPPVRAGRTRSRSDQGEHGGSAHL